ncbi:MAG: hypothetical protein OHK93_000404 [Ramalina farinacea]|uniref:Uncharacterized protein n=1 Tax=Ramalina farinacea TaxID=258253 RepID=A0AA43TV18_9LECA|nr:hypothetical protein [Ramalina farinacea]
MSVFSISVALIHILSLIPVKAHDRGLDSNDFSSSGDAGDDSASAAVAADYASLESMFNEPIMNLVPISIDQHTSKATAASTALSTHASTSGPGDRSTTAQLADITGFRSPSTTATTNPFGMPTGTGVGGSSGFLQYPTRGGLYHNTSPSGSAPSSGSNGGLPYQTQGAPYLNSSSPGNGGSGGSPAVGQASGLQPSMQPSGGSGPSPLGTACPPVQTVTLPASTVTLPAETVTVTAQAQEQITPQTLTTTVTTTVTITKDSECECSIPTGNSPPNPASAPMYPMPSGPGVANSAGKVGPTMPAGSQPAKPLPDQASQIGTGTILGNPPPETVGNANPQPSFEVSGAVMPGGGLPPQTSQPAQVGLSPSSPGSAQPASGGPQVPQVPQSPGTQPSQGGATDLPQLPASQAPLTAPYGNATGNAVMPTSSGSSGSGCPTAGSKGSGLLPFPSSLVSSYPLQGTGASLAPFPAPGNGTKGIMSSTGTGIPLMYGTSASFPVPGGGSLPGFPTGSQPSMGFATTSSGVVPPLATGVQQPFPSYSPPNSPLASPASATPQSSSSKCFSNHTSLQKATATFDELVTLKLSGPAAGLADLPGVGSSLTTPSDGSSDALIYQGLNFTSFTAFNSSAAASAPNMLLAPASSNPKMITNAGGGETSLSIFELWLACVKADSPGSVAIKKKRSRFWRWGLEGRAIQAADDENAVVGQDCLVTITGTQPPSTSPQAPSRAGYLSVAIPASQKGMKQVTSAALTAFTNMNEVRFGAQMGGQPCGVGIDNVSYEIWGTC